MFIAAKIDGCALEYSDLTSWMLDIVSQGVDNGGLKPLNSEYEYAVEIERQLYKALDFRLLKVPFRLK